MQTISNQSMQTQYSVLGCRVDLYFHDFKIVIKIHKKGHDDEADS